MSKISYEEILSIQRKVNIVDIVKDYVPLTQKGRNYFGVCPFHDDHNPSMSVSPEKQMYKCFVCGASGNVFNFVMEYEKVSYYEAVKIVADKIGITIDIGNIKREETKKSPLYDMYDISYKLYQNNLNTKYGKDAKEYLKNRNIDNDIIKEFKIGLSTTGTEISSILLKKGYKEDELLSSGLCYKTSNGLHDIYKNRIMFPLMDLNGNVVAFSGRIYNEKSDNKYINTSETDIFKKGNLLYNYHIAKEEARKEKSIIVVEGFMDVIRLSTIGVRNVVALMGTALTKNQANLIRKLSSNIILMFDGDGAGDKATLSFINAFDDSDATIKVVRLEDNLDPDEYILTKGKDKLLDHLLHPMNKISYKLDKLKDDINFSDSIDVSKYVNLAVKELEKIDDDIVRGIETKKVSSLTGISVEKLNSSMNLEKNEPVIKFEIKKENIKADKYDKASKYIIYNMIKNNSIILYYYNNLSYLPNNLYRKLANEIVLFYKKFNSFTITDFVTYLEDKKELIDLINKIDDMDIKPVSELNEIDGYFKTIREYTYKKEINDLTIKLKTETNKMKRQEIAQKIVEIKMKESM